jgi:hypothetical protein
MEKEKLIKRLENLIDCINDNSYLKPKESYKLDYEVEETWLIEIENIIQELESDNDYHKYYKFMIWYKNNISIGTQMSAIEIVKKYIKNK